MAHTPDGPTDRASTPHTRFQHAGWQVEWHTTVGSTNDVLAADPHPWRAVVADHQGTGRGRRGRSWQAPPGASLAISSAIAAPVIDRQGWVPLLAGVAVSRAFEQCEPGMRTRLKWPNDVLAGDGDPAHKICGILAERVMPQPGSDADAVIIVGSGVNIDQDVADLPVATATSWRICRGGDTVGQELRREFLEVYLDELAALTAGDDSGREAYLERCDTLGREIVLHLPGDRTVTGRAVDIDAAGGLVVERAGMRHTYLAGDVVHLRR